ncbi:MAG: chorismate mutase [bacterium]|nr:chorismate mutase [bacterium]
MTEELSGLRRRIDECDAELVRLIAERLRVCQEVGRFKGERGMEIRVPEREGEVISRVLKLNDGPCPPETLEKIFRLLIEAAVRLEAPEAPAPPKD